MNQLDLLSDIAFAATQVYKDHLARLGADDAGKKYKQYIHGTKELYGLEDSCGLCDDSGRMYGSKGVYVNCPFCNA